MSSDSISSEISTLNTDTMNTIFKSDAPPITLGGAGVILPCLELCNIGSNLQSQSVLNIINQSGRIYIQPDINKLTPSSMFPCYSSIKMCDEDNASEDDLFTLVNIIITCPSLHKITVESGNKIYNGEVFMVFENTTNSTVRYKVMCSFIKTTSSITTASNNNSLESYNLFTEIINNIPDKDNMNEINFDWELSDLLPKTQTFFNYFHPNNTSVSMYVYEDPIYVPDTFRYTFVDSVSQAVNQNNTTITGSEAYQYIRSTIRTLTNPPNFGNDFFIYYHRDNEDIYSGSVTNMTSSSTSGSSTGSSTGSSNSSDVTAESCAALLDGSTVTTTTTTKVTNYGDSSNTNSSSSSNSSGSSSSSNSSGSSNSSSSNSSSSNSNTSNSNTSNTSSSSNSQSSEELSVSNSSNSSNSSSSEEKSNVDPEIDEQPLNSIISFVVGIIYLLGTGVLVAILFHVIKSLKQCGAIEFIKTIGSTLVFFTLYVVIMVIYNAFYSFYKVYAVTTNALFIINTILFSLMDLALLILWIIFIFLVVINRMNWI